MKATIETIGLKINALADSERITKALLSELSREVLAVVLLDDGNEGEVVKGTEDSRTINELIDALTPVNRKVAIEFFTAMVPFIVMSDENGEFLKFGGKDKKKWDDKVAAVSEWLSDPMNNIWSWAARHIEIVKKPYNVNDVTKAIEKALKKKASKADILQAVFSGGLTMEDILAIIEPKEEAQPE